MQASRAWHIALISGTALALELAFIREVPAEVPAISYFTNLILMSSFFGLGVGCMLQRTRSVWLLFPLGLSLVAAFVYFTRGLLVFERAQVVHYWLEQNKPEGVAPDLPLFPAALMAFAACALPFVALGQRLAQAMNAYPRLVAYAWDILGSLVGTLIFVAASASQVPPWIWPLLLTLLWAAVLLRSWRSRALHVGAGALFLVFSQAPYPSQWSPYYFIQHHEEASGLRVWVNSSFHQFAINLDPRATSLASLQSDALSKFGVPYQEYRKHHAGVSPSSVLILGAGTGNDVNVALQNGARHITAVEIDPLILALGKRLNPTKPYENPRVSAVVDDARHFLHSGHEQFDLIVFGTLDSQTLLSSQANLRLENYVYTEQSFQDVARRLRPSGMLAAYYSIFKPWLTGRLYRTICSQFSGHCQVKEFDEFLFNTLFIAAPGIADFRSDPKLDVAAEAVLPSTDDWPFLYLEEPTIAPVYLELIGAVLALIACALWFLPRSEGRRRDHLNFLCLGMGFTLMESAAVVRLALLFGSTWVINAVVFSSVLAMVFLANLAVQRDIAPRLTVAWGVLLACVTLNYAIEPAIFIGLSPLLRALGCAMLIGAPVFFASVCFSRLFQAQSSSGYALGINLIGAMAGGFAEYLSMLIGMRAVWLLVLVVYLLAWLTTSQQPRRAG
jgi:SAM-dependent methyltransferase